MKQRKKLPYLALFIDDWMASAKVRKCSETTRGVYTDLLCILHKEPRRGSYSLHDQELKPNNTRSKTQLALAKPSEYQRLPYFAEFLVKRTGSSKAVILKALQELFERKILVIEGDTLIQPRMYRDSGYRLLSDMEENETQEAADGEIGELVLTTLCREAMPLLRYRTRDLTRVLGRTCPCGRNHVRLDRMRGRSDDMIVLRGVNIFPIQIEKIQVLPTV